MFSSPTHGRVYPEGQAGPIDFPPPPPVLALYRVSDTAFCCYILVPGMIGIRNRQSSQQGSMHAIGLLERSTRYVVLSLGRGTVYSFAHLQLMDWVMHLMY